MAPRWEVVGTRYIDLSREDLTQRSWKAENGVHPGNNGANGKPGDPGGYGESFFGIGNTFVGGDKLRISSDGGRGGRGQDGGDGARGKPGKDAVKPSEHDPKCGYYEGKFREFKCKQEDIDVEFDFFDIPRYRFLFTIFGETGGKGGDGGKAGRGGRGGRPGNIDILPLGQPSKIRRFFQNGRDGEDGEPGGGGLGGRNGHNVQGRVFEYFKTAFHSEMTTEWYDVKVVENDLIGENGNRGGLMWERGSYPEEAKGIRRLPYIINEYKNHLREHTNNRFLESVKSLELIDDSNDVRKLYDIFALIDEFQGLEKQFLQLGNRTDFSPFYDSLLERIRAFAEGVKDDLEKKKVLHYLYTAALGRIRHSKEVSERSLIINMLDYLKVIQEEFKTLKNLQTINNKVDVVNKLKDNYKNAINTKVAEAESLIKNEIEPAMNSINDNIDSQVKTLIEEVAALEKQEEKNWEKESKERKALQDAMELKMVFNSLKIIGGVANFLGPYGKIAGAALDFAGNVGSTFALDDQEKQIKLPSDVASTVDTVKEQLETLNKEKVTGIEKLFENVDEAIKKNNDTLGGMTSEIKKYKERLKKAKDKEAGILEIRSIKKDLEKYIDGKEMDLKALKKNEKSFTAIKALEKVSQLAKFTEMFPNMYKEMKEDNKKLDKISQNMNMIRDKIVALRQYEDRIYDTIAPMLQGMGNNMKDISAKLGTKSHVALDVTKWQVQSSLKDMQFKMRQLTDGYKVKEDFARSIDKLEAVMTTLIALYDRIQNYEDQQKLASYIADISSVAASNINVKDQRLALAVNTLEFTIRANIVLELYNSAFASLKQWVFPFSERYIEPDILPSQLVLEKNIENLVRAAMRQVETLRKKLLLYRASIQKGDQKLLCEEFNSRYVSSEPFYAWKREEHRFSVSRLFSGEKVVLKADVHKSAPGKDAIKFVEIEFEFKTNNETSQHLLSEVLKGFDINATHLGDSYYRYEGETTLITSDSVAIYYSNEKNNDGIPIRTNEVYNNLRSGDILLSPYTLWEVRMINKTRKYSFQDLKKYENVTSVELSGLGTYVMSIAFSDDVSFADENNTLSESPARSGLKECRRSKYRSEASGIAEDGELTTNDTSIDVTSPVPFFSEDGTNDCPELDGECTKAVSITEAYGTS